MSRVLTAKKEYFLKFWGKDDDKAVMDLSLHGKHFYFDSAWDRQKFKERLSPYYIVFSEEEGELTHKKTLADITLDYKGHIYSYTENFGYEYPADSARYMYEEGNYACDCNRSLFIERHCNDEFQEMGCGDEIKLVSLKIRYEA